MWDMLTEKELENYKSEMKKEKEKQIKILEEKIEDWENSKKDEQFEDIINPLASPCAGAPALKYGCINTVTPSPGEVKGLMNIIIKKKN